MQQNKLSLRKQAPENAAYSENNEVSATPEMISARFRESAPFIQFWVLRHMWCVFKTIIFPTGRVWHEWWLSVVRMHVMLLKSVTLISVSKGESIFRSLNPYIVLFWCGGQRAGRRREGEPLNTWAYDHTLNHFILYAEPTIEMKLLLMKDWSKHVFFFRITLIMRNKIRRCVLFEMHFWLIVILVVNLESFTDSSVQHNLISEYSHVNTCLLQAVIQAALGTY